MPNLLELGRIDRSIDIKAPVERVWRALSEPAELSSWFRVTIDGEMKPGGTIWLTSQHSPYAGMRFEVRIVELTRPSRVVWQWHPGDLTPGTDYSSEPMTTVVFTLHPTADGTRVEVTETGFDELSLARRAKAFAENSQGWAEVTVWLKNHVEASH